MPPKKAPPSRPRTAGSARDDALRQRLIDDALVEDPADTDSYGRPRRLWNAVEDFVFVGVSTNEAAPRYNCYPEVPATHLVDELARRSQRALEDLATGPRGGP